MEKVDFELGFERALGLGGWGAFWGMRDWIEWGQRMRVAELWRVNLKNQQSPKHQRGCREKDKGID